MCGAALKGGGGKGSGGVMSVTRVGKDKYRRAGNSRCVCVSCEEDHSFGFLCYHAACH